MILIDTNISKENLSKCIQEIETATFYPVSIDYYRTFVYENMAKNKLPSLEYYRYKQSKNALELLLGLHQSDGSTSICRPNEIDSTELDIPNLEFLYAQHIANTIQERESTNPPKEDSDLDFDFTEILLGNEENKFTNSENDDKVTSVDTKAQDIVDDTEISSVLPTNTKDVPSFESILENKEALAKRATSTWNNMSATGYKPIAKPNSAATVQTTDTKTDSFNFNDILIPKTKDVENQTKHYSGDIRTFLKEHPNSEMETVLKYFSKKDVDKALKLGRIMRKGTILHI